MDNIMADLDDIERRMLASTTPVDETQKSGRWVVQGPSPKDVADHVDPVLYAMPRTRNAE